MVCFKYLRNITQLRYFVHSFKTISSNERIFFAESKMMHTFHRFTPSTALSFLLLSLYPYGDCSSIKTNCTILIHKDSNQSLVNCNYNQELSVIRKEHVVYHHTLNYADKSPKKDPVLECRWNASQNSLVCCSDNMPKKIQHLSNFSFQFPMSDTDILGVYKCQVMPDDYDIFETCLIIKENRSIPSSHSPASNKGTDARVAVGVGVGVSIFLILVILGFVICWWYRRKKTRTGHPTVCTEDPSADANNAEHPLLLNPLTEVVCGPGSGDQITRQHLASSQTELKGTGTVVPPVISQSLGGDTTDSSCKAVSDQWTADKENILSECGNLTESSSEHEVDRCMLECRKLECECTLYLQHSNALGACADLSKEELSYIERLSGRAVTELKRLASLHKTVLRKRFMSKLKVIKQQNDRPQEIEKFVHEVKQTCKDLWDEDAEEMQLDLSRQNLKKLLELEIGCTHYIQVSQKNIPALGNQTDYAKRSKDLVSLLQEVQELQVIFETSLSEAVVRLVLRKITKGKSNKEEVTDEQFSDEVHDLAQRMSLIILDPENVISTQEDGRGLEVQKE